MFQTGPVNPYFYPGAVAPVMMVPSTNTLFGMRQCAPVQVYTQPVPTQPTAVTPEAQFSEQDLKQVCLLFSYMFVSQLFKTFFKRRLVYFSMEGVKFREHVSVLCISWKITCDGYFSLTLNINNGIIKKFYKLITGIIDICIIHLSSNK